MLRRPSAPSTQYGVVIDLLNAANPGPIQLLTGDGTNLQGLSGAAPPPVTISAVTADITSVPNALAVGFNAQVRVILEGNDPTATDFPGLTLESNETSFGAWRSTASRPVSPFRGRMPLVT